MNAITKPSVLVVDSDPALLSQTVRILNPDDFNVFTAVCRSSALSAASKLELDLILCDYPLATGEPGMDLIEEIYTIEERSDVPVIFTSSGQQPGVIRRQHSFGGAYHVKQPLDATVLITLVERSLWMPHLVQTHIQRPHFTIGPMAPAQSATTSNWNTTIGPFP